MTTIVLTVWQLVDLIQVRQQGRRQAVFHLMTSETARRWSAAAPPRQQLPEIRICRGKTDARAGLIA